MKLSWHVAINSRSFSDLRPTSNALLKTIVEISCKEMNLKPIYQNFYNADGKFHFRGLKFILSTVMNKCWYMKEIYLEFIVSVIPTSNPSLTSIPAQNDFPAADSTIERHLEFVAK